MVVSSEEPSHTDGEPREHHKHLKGKLGKKLRMKEAHEFVEQDHLEHTREERILQQLFHRTEWEIERRAVVRLQTIFRSRQEKKEFDQRLEEFEQDEVTKLVKRVAANELDPAELDEAGTLDLRAMGLDQHQVSKVAYALKTNDQATRVIFHGESQGLLVEPLRGLPPKNGKYTNAVVWSEMELTHLDALAIARLFETNNQLTRLNLHDNRILPCLENGYSMDGIQALAEAATKNKWCQFMRVDSFNIPLQELKTARPLVTLAGKNLHSFDAYVIAKCMVQNTAMTSLDLSDNPLTAGVRPRPAPGQTEASLPPVSEDKQGVLALAEGLSALPNLTSLNLKGCGLREAQKQAIGRGLLDRDEGHSAGICSLFGDVWQLAAEAEALDLSGVSLSPGDLLMLGPVLRGHSNLRTLNLSGLGGTATGVVPGSHFEGVAAVLDGMASNRSVTALSLAGLKLAPNGSGTGALPAPHDRLTHLGPAFRTMLEGNGSLLHLHLRGCQLGPEACAALVAAANVQGRLQTLDLARNEAAYGGRTHAHHIAALCASLERNVALTSLSLSDCLGTALGHVAATHMAGALRSNYFLRVLDLSQNRLGATGAAEVLGTLTVNATLASVDLSETNLTDGGKDEANALLLANVLRKNKTLTCLRVASNRITVKGVKAILKALEANNVLMEMDLQGNIAGSRGMAEDAMAMFEDKGVQLLV